MKIELIDTDKVIAYPNNPRKNPAVDKVAASIKEFGFRQPIVVDEQMVVIVGHTRLLAAKKLNIPQVPVHIALGLSAKQAAAYRLADNRVQEAEWDNEKLALELKELDGFFSGFDNSEIKTLFANQEKYHKDENDSPEPPAQPISKIGDMYLLGDHKVICGDSTDPAVYDKLLGTELVNLVLTDPPYNVAYDQSKNPSMNGKEKHKIIANDDMDEAQFNSFLHSAFKPAIDKMKPGAVFYCFHADRTRLQFEEALIKAGIKLTASLVWVKNCLVLSRLDYQSKHEPILYGWKEGAAHYWSGDRTLTSVIEDETDFNKLPKEQLIKMLNELKTTVIKCDKPSKADLHPTMKPIKLCQELIENSSQPEWAVLDMFGGSGSTLIACEKSNRKARLIELDPGYVDVIVKRWSDFTGKTAQKI